MNKEQRLARKCEIVGIMGRLLTQIDLVQGQLQHLRDEYNRLLIERETLDETPDEG
jgi:hypothetical protein